MKIQVKSPGRVNLIGEHTDYNGGYVLPCALNLSIIISFETTQNISCVITDLGYSMNFDVKDNYIKSDNHWENYILGVVNELKYIKKDIVNFTCNIESSLPSGAGISSSSALVCGVIKGLAVINKIDLNNSEIIDISRNVEHKYIGVLGGIMDQYTILNAKKNSAILLNCNNLNSKYIDLDLGEYELLLLDTKIKHNLANTEYNKRVSECKEALDFINKKIEKNYQNLSQVSVEELKTSKDKLNNKLYQRAIFVINENRRTINSAKLLEEKKLKEFGSLMYQSHLGLMNNYEVSCRELDFLVEKTKKHKDVLGSRMMGGGFGGCTINLVNKKFTKDFIEKITKDYKLKFSLDLGIIIAEPDSGIQIKLY